MVEFPVTVRMPIRVFSLDRNVAGEIWRLALPVVTGMASITAIGLTDTIMVGRLGAAALAATGQAAVIFWAVHWVARSIEVAAQALVARRYGEQQPEACGAILDNAAVMAVAIGAAGAGLLFFGCEFLMTLMSSHGTVIASAVSYIRVLAPFLLISGPFFAFRGFYSGIGKTRIFLVSALIMLAVNVVGNYIFIFGKFGMPRLEVPGAAVGSAAAFVASLLFMICFSLGLLGQNYRRRFGFFRWRKNIRWTVIRDIWMLASPNALRGVMVIGGLAVFYAMVDHLDVVQVAIVNVVLNIQSVSFMPGYGFGVAAATMIGQHLGAGEPDKAERAGYESAKLGVLFMGTLGVFFLVIPEWIVVLFTDDPIVIGYAAYPLRLVGVVQILDAAGMVFSSALEGAGNTRWVMKAEIFVNWGIFLPLTYLFTFPLGLHRYGPWIAWAAYMMAFGIMCFLKFRDGRWKHIRI